MRSSHAINAAYHRSSGARALVSQKLALIEQRIADLKRLRAALNDTVDACLKSEANGERCALKDAPS